MNTDSVVSGRLVKLGKLIKLSPKSVLTHHNPDYKKHFYQETVELTIGIGKDHSATLIMSIDDWKALKAGEKIWTATVQDIKKGLK